MVNRSPFRIEIWSKTFQSMCLIGDPQRVDITPRHNQKPTGTFVIPVDHPKLDKLIVEGARATIDYHGQQLVSGPIDRLTGTGTAEGTVTVELEDDWSFFADTLGWPVPTAAIGSQSSSEYDTKIGPAETVVKYFAQRAITRLGLPITVAPDQGRGADIIVRVRMQSLADMLFPTLDQAGIGVTIRQNGAAGLVLDCYETAWYPIVLKPHTGVVRDWEWSRARPKVTRAVAGGTGEGTARVFREVIDTAAEDLWHAKREVFVDASSADTTAEVDAQAQTAITDGAASAGLKLTLAETESFRYGEQLRVGDLVTTQLVPGTAPITNVLREAPISWTSDEGLLVVPSVGDRQDDPNKTFVQAISSLARAIRIDRARR